MKKIKNKIQPLMTTIETAEYLGVSWRTVQNWRALGIGPKFKRLGHKTVRYSKKDLDKFVR